MIQAHIVRRNQDGDWLFLCLRRAPSESIYPNLWQPVTGRVDEGETAVQTAFREIHEETGIQPQELWVLPYVGSFFSVVRNAVVLVPCFGAVLTEDDCDNAGDLVQLSEEHSEYQWLGLEQTLAMLVLPSHREATIVFHSAILNALDSAPFARVTLAIL